MREECIGKMALFLVPSLKLKGRSKAGRTVEDRIHRFLLRRFGGYTAAAGNIFGYWRDKDGKEFYGEHKEYKVGLIDEKRLPELKTFLSSLSAEIGEECIYLETGKEASFVYAEKRLRK
jgi:hypothetical protein